MKPLRSRMIFFPGNRKLHKIVLETEQKKKLYPLHKVTFLHVNIKSWWRDGID